MEMKDNTGELFDYLRVIWKRRILIIVVTLVGVGVGVGLIINMRLKPKALPTYRSVGVLKLGEKVVMDSTGVRRIPIENAGDLLETIPLKYVERISEAPEYHFDIKPLGTPGMLQLRLEGRDKETERVLEKTVDMVIDEHRKKNESSTAEYKRFISKLEADEKMIIDNIDIIEKSLVKMKLKEKEFIKNIEKDWAGIEEERDIGIMSVIWNMRLRLYQEKLMLYLKTIDKEIQVSSSRKELRNIQWQLLVHRTTIGSLDEYSTRMVGDIESTLVEQKKNNAALSLMVGGFAGLIMSLLIAFFMEYFEESKSRRKGK